MQQLAITARKRTQGSKGALSALRRQERVPGVVYGLKKEPETLDVAASDLRPLLAHRNVIIDLDLDGAPQRVLLKQVDRDPIKGHYVHVDFLRVDESQPVVAVVPVVTEGVATGVKNQGGFFKVAKKFVRLRAKLPDVPEKFVIDISDMESGKTFYVSDLKLDKGVFITPPRTALFGISEARGVKAEEAAAAPAAAKDAKDVKDAKEGEKAEATPPAKGGKK